MANEQLVADLKAAREIVEQGWHKGGIHDGRGNVCAIGALNKAIYGAAYPRYAPTPTPEEFRLTLAYKALQKHVPRGLAVAVYNDEPQTTKEDILVLYDKALADLGGL